MCSSCLVFFFSMPLIFIFTKYSIACIGKTYSVSSCVLYSSVLFFFFFFLPVNVPICFPQPTLISLAELFASGGC